MDKKRQNPGIETNAGQESGYHHELGDNEEKWICPTCGEENYWPPAWCQWCHAIKKMKKCTGRCGLKRS